MTSVTCECGVVFEARPADIKRGWAKSCSKSCAARRTNRKTGNFQHYMDRQESFSKHGELVLVGGASGSVEDQDCNKSI